MFNQGNAATVQIIETDLEGLKEFDREGEVLERLLNNPDFQEIILDGYCKKEPHRIALASGNPILQSAESQEDLFSQVKGVGHLMAFLRNKEKIIAQARKSMVEHEEELLALELEAQQSGLEA